MMADTSPNTFFISARSEVSDTFFTVWFDVRRLEVRVRRPPAVERS